MAIYDLGTASLAANGEVTGVGTTWKAPLTLIRVGATIVFKTEPVQIYTISEIISDTQINVYNPNSETVPAGTGYAILAHDGITVQGLAQDVAETLRYYQSRDSLLLEKSQNLSDVDDIAQARDNLDVPSNAEALLAANNLSDVDDIAQARDNLDVPSNAEALLAANNLSELSNKATSRTNLDVYSKAEVYSKTEVDNIQTKLDSWTVYKNTTPTPPTGTLLPGGLLSSEVRIDGSMHVRSLMRADAEYGRRGGGVWLVEDSSISNYSHATFNIGSFTVNRAELRNNGGNIIAQSIQQPDGTWPVTSPSFTCQLTNRVPNPGNPGGYFGINMSENVGVDAYGSVFLQASGVNQSWLFNQFGNAISPGVWVNNSDERIKTNIQRIENPLEKMRDIRGCTWDRLDIPTCGIGFIAQDVEKVFPSAVSPTTDRELMDGTIVERVKSVDTIGVSAALHHEAILALMDKIESLESKVAELSK